MTTLNDIHCYLLDMDGTFYLGDRLLPGALEFIHTLRQQGKDYLFLTNNSSKAGKQYAEKITHLGLPVDASKVMTSGEAAAVFLADRSPGARVFLVGTAALEQVFREHGFELRDDNPEMVMLGFDTGITYAKLWRLCDLVRAGLPYIATHPDINCPVEGGYMPDIGATIAFVKASTGREPDQTIGKPNEIMINVIARKMDVAKSHMAIIGDRLYTDIALRQTAGIFTILVLSGETEPADLLRSPYQPDLIFENLGEVARTLETEGSQAQAGGPASADQ